MQKVLQRAKKVLDVILEKEVNVLVWSGSFLGIIGLRIFMERVIVPESGSVFGDWTNYLQDIFFFLIAYVIIWLILSKIMQIKPQKLAFLFLGAAWLTVLPPILDMLKTGGGVFWSFYAVDDLAGIWGEFITFFGRLPSGIVYFGTKIVFAITILLVFALVYAKTEKLWKSLLGSFLTYVVLFFMGTFPSWLAYGYYYLAESQKITEIKGFQAVQLFGAPAKIFGLNFGDLSHSLAYNLNLIYFLILIVLLSGLFLAINKQKMVAVLKNARFPQLVYHAGLLAVGLGLGFLAYPSHFSLNIFSLFAVADLLISIWLAWLASVIINDIYDFAIDAISNPERPLQKGVFSRMDYFSLGGLLFGLSVLGGLVVSMKFALLLLAYQFLAWAYSAPPFRLKKFPGVATFVSSLASFTVLLLGFFLFSGDQNIVGLSWRIILLLVIALTLSLPIKDFKDIAGDKKYQIWTIPVMFGEERGRLIVAVGIFVSFMLSVFLLNEFRLFWWALLAGITAFLIVINKKPRQLFWWVLGVVSIYGIILVKVLFL